MDELVPAPNKDVKPYHFEVDYTIDVDKILTPAKRAKIVGWYIEDMQLADRLMGVFDNYPIVCKAEKCMYAKSCKFSTDRRFLNTPCIVERVQAFQLFLAYVRELDVSPAGITDITMIGNLIKLNLDTRRIELHLSSEDVTEEIVTYRGDSKSIERKINILLEESRLNRAEISKTYDKLLISRESRMKKAVAEGNSAKDALSIIQSVLARSGNTRGTSASRKKKIQPELEATSDDIEDVEDATFVDTSNA